MAYHQPFQVTGFHSCDREVGVRALNGELDLIPSDNIWDWLGGGVYFWEQNPERALQYAVENANGTQKNKKRIKTPFVIGSTIELGHCLNLLEPKAMEIVQRAHDALVELHAKSDTPLPKNEGAKRSLDCAVIKFVHEICVINEAMIKGYFLPRPLDQFNPYLKKDFIPTPRTNAKPSIAPQ